MARFLDEAQAASAGFHIAHEPKASRYVVYQGAGADRQLVGEAHYSLRGDHSVDFDHTSVSPSLRGTGLAALLARRALTGDQVRGRQIEASCWFIAGFLERHPELRSQEHTP
ncbi:GNAT family N-acetyltransferase [Leucobacter salsicius]|uniref:GNAT family N-acetyltransferase n=1 Tax=Leucobacter salsicius TaxID=664638 RepID=UPI00034DD157|nr:N-acetyltransferase [Leucobacter salsicius]